MSAASLDQDGRQRLVDLVVTEGQTTITHANLPPYYLEDHRKRELCPVCRNLQEHAVLHPQQPSVAAQAPPGPVVSLSGRSELHLNGYDFTAATMVRDEFILHEMTWREAG